VEVPNPGCALIYIKWPQWMVIDWLQQASPSASANNPHAAKREENPVTDSSGEADPHVVLRWGCRSLFHLHRPPLIPGGGSLREPSPFIDRGRRSPSTSSPLPLPSRVVPASRSMRAAPIQGGEEREGRGEKGLPPHRGKGACLQGAGAGAAAGTLDSC
jgi:hypothetical protein